MERKPDWLKVRYNQEAVDEVAELMRDLKLNTVCKEANCPNLGECYRKHTATFMILGSVCTRNCRFCNVTTGRPCRAPGGAHERGKGQKKLNLRHVVLTCSTRDDLPDGGGGAVCQMRPGHPGGLSRHHRGDADLRHEGGSRRPGHGDCRPSEVLNHNVETVWNCKAPSGPRPGMSGPWRSLRYCRRQDPTLLTKTGFHGGPGRNGGADRPPDGRHSGNRCDILTIGQYLQPRQRLPLARYATPEDFARWKELALLAKGFRHVASAPLGLRLL